MAAGTYLLAKIKSTPSKYLAEAEPIIKANAKMILLSDKKRVNGLLS